MKFLLSASLLALSTVAAVAGDCPKATVADMQGLTSAYPQQFELAELEKAASCALSFSENPDIAALNARILGNPEKLPAVADRLPAEPLVVAPYEEIGVYGGVLKGMSNATEAGTSDLLSVRHVNLVRFSDDLVTIVPNVAKSWKWNENFTELTMTLRKGHKWSDGEPFTAEDVAFWYNDMTMNSNVVEKPRDLWTSGGEPIEVVAVDDVTVIFKMKEPKPGLLSNFATDYAQPFQPKHVLSKYLPKYNPDADKLAKELGFETGYDVIKFYYNGSDWKDVPSPLFKDEEKAKKLDHAVLPTLESMIVVKDTTEDRQVVANPYFFQVDTAGQQLPYINELHEAYIPDNEVKILKMVNGEVDYKAQSVSLPDAPALLDGQEKGKYTVELRPQIGLPTFSFNVTDNDEEKRDLFNNRDFRLAMSHAINREEINHVAYFDLGEPKAYIAFDPVPPFATEEQVKFATEFDPEAAKSALDKIGMVDKDGDGFRDLPSGNKFTLNIQFSTQGMATSVVELVAQNWNDVGVETKIKEVTSDEYRAAQSANELDVMAWTRGQPVAVMQGSAEELIPPFSTYFGLRNGMLWSQWMDSEGKEGIEPPKWVFELKDLITEWQSYLPGTEDSNKIGARIIDLLNDSYIFIGTVQAPNPIYHSNALKNFETPKTWSYEYYRTYPYRSTQWFFAKD
ncbi:ABC transporter substrate-binding protein [uncultured Cohaesibacter sp.]|uniref:ABC transporter substrate-binding protein n=1 Tax=uncultured Cohaesibacter sp. TaxID=1002546 RepID=UPI00292FF015|nr:ABC transporter substrate-binding protein [uncultured Cohaesibacter sp.]